MRRCVKFYLEFWTDRNTRRNSDSIRRKRLKEWDTNERRLDRNQKLPQVRKFLDNGFDTIMRSSADTIQQRLIQLHSVRKIAEIETESDIRLYFSVDQRL